MGRLTERTDSDAMTRCRELVAGYLRHIDSGRATEGIDVFAPDAQIEAHGRVFRGRAEILGFLADREANRARQTVHVLANEVMTSGDAEPGRDGSRCIESRALVLLHIRQPDGCYRLERVLDAVHQLHHIDNQWRITRRTMTPLHT
jgi:SnoaL-like protein